MNYTRDAIKGIADHIDGICRMGEGNGLAKDMILPGKSGVGCVMRDGQHSHC